MEQAITFGPFRMAHLQEQIDERFRQAFFDYVVTQVIPRADGRIVRVEGKVTSHYDQPQFVPLAEVRHRFFYELSLISPRGIEEALGELDFHAATASWTPSQTKAPAVNTLTKQRRRQALIESFGYELVRPAACPHCQAGTVAEIHYGLRHHTEQMEAEIEAGRICEGGCWDWENSQPWRCLSCRHEWGPSRYMLALRDIEAREGPL